MSETTTALPTKTGSSEITRLHALRHGVLSNHTVLPWEEHADTMRWSTRSPKSMRREVHRGASRGGTGRSSVAKGTGRAGTRCPRRRVLPGRPVIDALSISRPTSASGLQARSSRAFWARLPLPPPSARCSVVERVAKTSSRHCSTSGSSGSRGRPLPPGFGPSHTPQPGLRNPTCPGCASTLSLPLAGGRE